MITTEQRNEFPKYIQNLIDDSQDVLLTGSRYICPEVMPKDIDIMLRVDNIQNFMTNNKLPFDDSQHMYCDDMFATCRHGIYNILLTTDAQYFLRWKYSTELATILNLTEKDDRKTLFKFICDSNKFEAITEIGKAESFESWY